VMITMVDIKPSKWFSHPLCDRSKQFPAKKSMPFVESIQGTYTHRVRYVTMYNNGKESHVAVNCWCGMSICISRRKPNRLCSSPSNGRKRCATCEGRAIGAGVVLPSVINGVDVVYSPRDAR